MTASEIVELLENNWNQLGDNLSDQWSDFISSYRVIVSKLPKQPKRADLERTIDNICNLLNSYEYSRGLLQPHLFPSLHQPRIARPGIDVMKEEEDIQQLCNRLTVIDSSNAREFEKKNDCNDKVQATEKNNCIDNQLP